MSGMAVATMVPSMEPMNIESMRVARTSGRLVLGFGPAAVMSCQYSTPRRAVPSSGNGVLSGEGRSQTLKDGGGDQQEEHRQAEQAGGHEAAAEPGDAEAEQRGGEYRAEVRGRHPHRDDRFTAAREGLFDPDERGRKHRCAGQAEQQVPQGS